MDSVYNYGGTFNSGVFGDTIIDLVLTVDSSNIITSVTGTIEYINLQQIIPVEIIPPGDYLNNDNILANISSQPYFNSSGFSFRNSSFGIDYNISNISGADQIRSSTTPGTQPFINNSEFLTAVCLLSNTNILTPDGYKLINDFKIADKVLSENKEFIVTRVIKNQIKKKEDYPFLIKEGMIFGNNKCIEDLYLSPGHNIKVNDEFCLPIRLGLEQIKNLEELENLNLKELCYFHLELTEDINNINNDVNNRRNNTLTANGIVVESFGLKNYFDITSK